MNEIDIINTITDIAGAEYIGNDCAYLRDFGIVVTQDSLVENIHFKRDWYTPFQLGYKSVVVNISDILASGAIPKYITIALSLPTTISNNFVTEFYNGAKSALNGVKIVGGDITGSKNDIFISITAIGSTEGRNISSRAYAKQGYVIITKGNYGSSALGLNELLKNRSSRQFIEAHIKPNLDYSFSETIAKNISEPYAMMDTSDGLADALFKIAEASNMKIVINYDKIPHLKEAREEQVLFGGEDYHLVAAIPKQYVNLIKDAEIIGYVEEFDGIRLEISENKFTKYSELNVYKHF